MRQYINDGWQFEAVWNDDMAGGFDGGVSVRIPHTVKEVPLHYIDPQDYQGISGYQKTLKIPEEEKGKRIFLCFDGCAHIAVVYWNGTKIMEHRNGYTGFRCEVTKLIRYGTDNIITVKLDTTENPEIPPFGFVVDYLTYGGIYRDVYLDIRNDVYLKDVFLYTPDLHTLCADVKCDGPLMNETVRISLKDGDMSITEEYPVTSGTYRIEDLDVQAWSPEQPHLCDCTVEILKNGQPVDMQEYKVGFRTVEVKGDKFLLNGKPYFITGLNRHQSWPYVGYAVPDALQAEDARILKEELHVNTVRTSHYPQSHAFIEACDRLGLLVFTEIPGWQHIGDYEWKRQAVENTKEMILEYRNHPSIVIWGVRINESTDDDAFYQMTNEVAHRLDPTRPTSGVRYLEKSSLKEDIYGYNDFSHSGKNPGVKKKKDVMKETDKPLLITEANGHMFPTKSWDPWAKRQEHALRHARVLNDAKQDGDHIGAIQWCMFDYATHKDFGSGDRICYHGVMDSFRNPKPAASVYASQNDNVPVLEVGSPMDIGDYAGGHIDAVYAFTNADEVRLYKNNDYVASFRSKEFPALKHGPVLIDDFIGELIRTKENFPEKQADLIHECLHAAASYGLADLPAVYKAKLAWCMLHYKMKYEEGVELYGKYVGSWGGDATEWRFDAIKDGECVKSVTKTPNTQLSLKAEASHTELREGKTYDMAAVRIRIEDAWGNIASYAQVPVEIICEGPAEIVGPHIVTCEGGMTGTYIRTLGKTGEAVLTLRCEGLEPAVIRFNIEGSR